MQVHAKDVSAAVMPNDMHGVLRTARIDINGIRSDRRLQGVQKHQWQAHLNADFGCTPVRGAMLTFKKPAECALAGRLGADPCTAER